MKDFTHRRFRVPPVPVCLFVLLAGALFPPGAQSAPDVPDIARLDSFLRETVGRYRIPGCAAALVNDEGVVFEFASGEVRPGLPIDRNSAFYLGSTAKAFTALAVMTLAKTGKMDIDAPVREYLPEFRLAVPKYENMITVRHLLNHTSGLSARGMPGTARGEESLEEELVALRGCRPVAAPGEKFEYFNVNYRILGLIVERVSGEKFGRFLNERIFDPLSMTNTTPGPDGAVEIVPAHGRLFGFPYVRRQEFRPGALPSGYIVSCTSDISKFLVDELRAGRGESGILDRGIVAETWKVPGDPAEGYGMGWIAVRKPGEPFVAAHGGSVEGFQSFFYLCPERNVGFVLLVNQGGLLPMIAGMNTLIDGTMAVLAGKEPGRGPGSVPTMIVAAAFLVVLLLAVFRLVRLRSWKKRSGGKAPWKPVTGIIVDFSISLFLLAGFNPMMNAVMGDKVDWEIVLILLPELFLALGLLIVSGFVTAGMKTLLLVHGRRSALRAGSMQ